MRQQGLHGKPQKVTVGEKGGQRNLMTVITSHGVGNILIRTSEDGTAGIILDCKG
jgi:hypothetical protein